MKRLEDLSTQELADLLHVSDMEAQKLLESAGPFMQTPVQEVREELRRLRNSLQPDKIPHDVANRWKQIRDLLYREPEFEIRYPAAYGLLMEPYYPENMDELGGLSLPSFGGRIFRHDPHEQVNYSLEPGEHYDAFTTRHSGGEAKGPLLKHEFEPLDLGYLQGILFEVLGRDEYWERLHKRSRDPDLILRYGAPDKSLIRLTDLRLARKLVAELKSEKFKDGTKRILDSLERPLTPDGVAKWKRQILDPASGFVKQRIGNPFDHSAPADWLEDRQLGVIGPSFSAAALLLFMDLDTPAIERGSSHLLAEKIWSLAELINKLMGSLSEAARELESLAANRSAGNQPGKKKQLYDALTWYRLGMDLKGVARFLGMTPYDRTINRGTRQWRQRTRDKLLQAQRMENEEFPRAAAIHAKWNNHYVQMKALQAYVLTVHDVKTGGYLNSPLTARPRWDWWGIQIGKKMGINTRTKRGREITKAYVELGFSQARGVPPLS